MLAGEQPTIFGDGEQSRDFTYIDNVVHANLLAADAPAERVGRPNDECGDRHHDLRSTRLFAFFANLPVTTDSRRTSAPRSGDIRDSLADIQLAGQLLGYSPIVDFREGLGRTVEWYRTGA